MEKLIPIVFALIWIGFKLYQKSAGNQQANQKNQDFSTDNNTGSLDQILQNLYSESSRPIEQVEVQREYKSVKAQQDDNRKSTIENVTSIEYTDTVKRNKKIENNQKEELKEKPEKIDYNFSLKQAIINHAILERPYK